MNDRKRKKTGLLFGSFNPVHTGHLIIASHFLQHTDLKEVWFVLSPQNPFKTEERLLAESKRLELLHLAIDDNMQFRVCDIELSMEKPSFTIHTIKKLHTEYPDREFVLLIGSDNLNDFGRWKNPEEILSILKVYVYPRKSDVSSHLTSHPSIKIVDAPRIDISSTQIRKDFQVGLEPRYLLPDKVLKKIKGRKYY